jgi:hypothetical protein
MRKPGPRRNGEPGLETQAAPVDYVHHSVADPGAEARVYADAGYQENFRRMAERAAADPDYYAITGSGVQRLADEIRDGVA